MDAEAPPPRHRSLSCFSFPSGSEIGLGYIVDVTVVVSRPSGAPQSDPMEFPQGMGFADIERAARQELSRRGEKPQPGEHVWALVRWGHSSPGRFTITGFVEDRREADVMPLWNVGSVGWRPARPRRDTDSDQQPRPPRADSKGDVAGDHT